MSGDDEILEATIQVPPADGEPFPVSDPTDDAIRAETPEFSPSQAVESVVTHEPQATSGATDGSPHVPTDAALEPVTPKPPLAKQHQALLDASVISLEAACARGYRTVTTKAEVQRLGFSKTQARAPALLLPLHNVHGEIGGYQIRPDEPRVNKSGKVVKYETPSGSRMLLDAPPGAREKLGDPGAPLFVTEGVRKADCAVGLGLCCIALIGVWNWRGTNGAGGKTALPDWESIALNDRIVYVVFDSDAMTNPAVHGALERLKAFLESRHAKVRLIYLPSGEGGTKVGLDDYIAAGHTKDDLLSLASTELRKIPGESSKCDAMYFEREGWLYYRRPTNDGEVEVLLANFTARIVVEIRRDDGLEQTRAFGMDATAGHSRCKFQVPSSQFAAMNWPLEHMGAAAIVSPGQGTKDRARAAIQTLSGKPTVQVVYTHTGWRLVDERRVFLHAGGAIGPIGTVPDIQVDLPGELARVELPAPPTGSARIEAINASLGLLELTGGDDAGDNTMVPVLGQTYRAVFGPTDVSVHLTGETGSYKTEIAARAAQHFGAGFDRLHLLGWSSTANHIEALSFAAKDTLMVVDDFVPQGTVQDRGRFQQQADRVYRGAGNRSGRGRLRADGTPRPTRSPRASILTTGEDVPQGRSCQARIVLVDVPKQLRGLPPKPGVVALDVLTRCQAEGGRGLYAAATAAFVQWIAGKHDERMAEVARLFGEFRDRARNVGTHARDPEKIAHLAVGWEMYLRFAVDAGAITPEQADALRHRVWAALGRMAEAQSGYQRASDPPIRFFELVASAVGSGAAHIANRDGGAPADEETRWGWAERTVGAGSYVRTEWHGRGSRIGWVDGDDLYLDADAALRVANAMQPGEYLGPADTLGKRMRERGLLRSTDVERERVKVRVRVEGRRTTAWHFHAETVIPSGERPNRPNRPNRPATHENGTGEPDCSGSGWAGSVAGGGPLALQPAQPAPAGPGDGGSRSEHGDNWADGAGFPEDTRSACETSREGGNPDSSLKGNRLAASMQAEAGLEQALRSGREPDIRAARNTLAGIVGEENAATAEAVIRAELEGEADAT